MGWVTNGRTITKELPEAKLKRFLVRERGEESLIKKIEWPSKKARQGMKEKYPAKKGLPLTVTGDKFHR